MIAVATSAAAAAAIAYPAVDASPHAPAWRGARTGMLNSHRHTRMPASAISAATTAVAAPPDHSCLASTVRVGELVRSERGSCCPDMAQAAGHGSPASSSRSRSPVPVYPLEEVPMFVTISLLMTAFCLLPAVGKLLGQPKMRQSAGHFGIPWPRYRLIGVAELAAAAGILIGLWWHPLSVAAAAGMTPAAPRRPDHPPAGGRRQGDGTSPDRPGHHDRLPGHRPHQLSVAYPRAAAKVPRAWLRPAGRHHGRH